MEKMMLKEANELRDTAVLRIYRKHGREMRIESIINAITRVQKASNPKPAARVPFPTHPKSKLSGQDPATPLARPTVTFHGFLIT